MTVAIAMGETTSLGVTAPATLDLEELLATRLLVQGNSGSGKSHLLRRLLEQSAPWVQQAVIDPEGDFVTLAERFGHLVIDAESQTEHGLQVAGERAREHRVSTVLNLEGLDAEGQMRHAAAFLGGLFEVSRDHWYPMLVVVDEAQLFAPAVAGEVSDEARKLSLGAMTNLMCRGRKRGLAGVIATQRLAKLAKNVAAEASNFLMGRTFLDIDMARAADLLGMERRQAEQIRDLARGHFLGLGPAISRRPVAVAIGAVKTGSRSVSHALGPLPTASSEELQALLHAEPSEAELDFGPPPVRAPEPDLLVERITAFAAAANATPGFAAPPPPDAAESAKEIAAILVEMAAEPDCTFQQPAVLYQDFSVRCRMRRLRAEGFDVTRFRRSFAIAVAGIADPTDERWADLLALARDVPEDLLAPFLLLARAAQEGAPCPEDAELARVHGTSSPGRMRRLLDHFEKTGLIVIRTDYSGRRSIGIPLLGTATEPMAA